jgi:hypothetical protein
MRRVAAVALLLVVALVAIWPAEAGSRPAASLLWHLLTQPGEQSGAPPPPTARACRAEIGDPSTVPTRLGLRPVYEIDTFDPSPELRQADVDPMVLWNTDRARVDDQGHVRVSFPDGHEYLHPVGSLNFALASIRQYRVTEDQVWLDRAVTAYEDVLSVATPEGLIPHEFPWPGPVRQILGKPAYSAMAQGEAVSVAVRLYELTGEQRWRDLADLFFATLDSPGTAEPAVAFVDRDGYLWFEEFPLACPGRVWNGHVFATFAMADYHWLTGSQRAADLFDAGATTALHYMSRIRRRGATANYNLSHPHPVPDLWYHRMMTNQLHYLKVMTGDKRFGVWADRMTEDIS